MKDTILLKIKNAVREKINTRYGGSKISDLKIDYNEKNDKAIAIFRLNDILNVEEYVIKFRNY